MKFFVPDQPPEYAEDIYNDFRALHNAADKRIRSITFLDRERRAEVQLCVGEPAPLASCSRIPARRGDHGASRKLFSTRCVMARLANSSTIPRRVQTMGLQAS